MKMRDILTSALTALAVAGAMAGGAAAPAAAEGGTLTILQPGPGTVWIEGGSGVVRWQGEATETGDLCIGLHAGGKDFGLINDCDTPAALGEFRWPVPEGRFTGFGPDHFDTMQVALWPAGAEGEIAESAPFTVAGFVPVALPSPEAAIRHYFEALDQGQMRQAYALLSPFSITLGSADGGQSSFRPRPDFATWEGRMTAWLSGVKLVSLKEVSGQMRWFRDPAPALGIRLFAARVAETHPDGVTAPADYFIYVAPGYLAGSGGETVYRLLDIGTGP